MLAVIGNSDMGLGGYLPGRQIFPFHMEIIDGTFLIEHKFPSKTYWAAVDKEYTQLANTRKGTVLSAFTYASGKNGESRTGHLPVHDIEQSGGAVRTELRRAPARRRLLGARPREWPGLERQAARRAAPMQLSYLTCNPK